MFHLPLGFMEKGMVLKALEARHRLVSLGGLAGRGPLRPHIPIPSSAPQETAAISHLPYGLKKACLTGEQTVI